MEKRPCLSLSVCGGERLLQSVPSQEPSPAICRVRLCSQPPTGLCVVASHPPFTSSAMHQTQGWQFPLGFQEFFLLVEQNDLSSQPVFLAIDKSSYM